MTEELSNDIEIIGYDKLEDFLQLIEELDENYYDKDIIDIIKLIPKENSVVLKKRIFEKIIEKTGLGLRELNNIEKSAENEITIAHTVVLNSLMLKWREKLENDNSDNEYMIYDNQMIEIMENEINLLSDWNPETNFYIPKYIAGFGLRILYKIIDKRNHNIELYTFYSNNSLYDIYGIEDFLDIKKYKMAKGNFGRDIVRYIFKEKEKNIPTLKAKYILGWIRKWILPFIQEDGLNKYAILCDTDEQKDVLKRSRKMYNNYTDEEKEKIKKYLRVFIKRTQIDPTYIAIIIGWSMIAPFKLYCLDTHNIFPTLILAGIKGAGKTRFLDLFTTHFYGLTKTHESGATAKSIARFEDIISASTFPRMIDDFENIPRVIINVIKESATDSSPYKRKTSAKTQISRPKVSPLAITSNDLGDEYMEPANSSRAVVPNFKDSIVKDNLWVKLFIKLKKSKLFSLMYDYTKDWTDKDLDNLMEETEKKFKIRLQIEQLINNKNFGKNYPRINETFHITLAGILLFEKIFDIKLKTDEVMKTLIKLRIQVSNNIVQQFISYVLEADKFEAYYSKDDLVRRTAKYITCELIQNSDGERYIQNTNVRDFNEFNKSKYKIKHLRELLQEGIKNKDMISDIKTIYCDSIKDSKYCFTISPEFINSFAYYTNLARSMREETLKKQNGDDIENIGDVADNLDNSEIEVDDI